MPLDTETLVFLVFIILAVTAFTSGEMGGAWSTDNPLIWGPALLFHIPFAILGALAGIPLLLPIAIILFIAYFNVFGDIFGEPTLALVLIMGVLVLLGI